MASNRNRDLWAAAWRGDVQTLHDLIKRGADPNSKETFSWTVLQLGSTALHAAAFKGHVGVIQALLSNSANLHAQDEMYQNTPLHVAAWNGMEGAVRCLVSATAIVNATNGNDDSPLHMAIRNIHGTENRSLNCVKVLLENGANVNMMNKKGEVPLQIASDRNYPDVIEHLIAEGAELSLLSKDAAWQLILQGKLSRPLLDQGDLDALGDISKESVKSTNLFSEKHSVKVVLFGDSYVGKTSLLRTIKNRRPVLMPDDNHGRTEGIELTVLHVHVRPDIRCFVYDFGGQDMYFPIHQAMITPYSIYTLAVDLEQFHRNMNDKEFVNKAIARFYYTVYQHVRSPVYQLVGTKADLLKEEQIRNCSEKLLSQLSEFEIMEKRRLEERRDQLIHAQNMLIGRNGRDNKFRLNNSEIKDKIDEVEVIIKHRPKLPNDVIIVSSKNYTGIEDWTNDIARTISDNKQLFPSTDIPLTWIQLSDHLRCNLPDVNIRSCTEFSEICKTFSITTEKEIQILIHHLRIVGQILLYENHPVLRDTIFVNPDHILNSMTSLINHNYCEDAFWENSRAMQNIPLQKRKLYQHFFQEKGIVSKTVINAFLEEKGVRSNHDEMIHLMCMIDLCFKLDHGDVLRQLNEDCYIVPSLLKYSPSEEMNEMWRRSFGLNEIIVSVNLVSGSTPTGIHQRITTRINHHMRNRCDIAKRTLAETKFGATFEMKFNEEALRLLLTVRYQYIKHRAATNFMKTVITRMINILSNFPSVLWDMYTECPRCLASGASVAALLLPAEACIFLADGQRYSCDTCHTEYDFTTGFPLIPVSMISPDKFECIERATALSIGKDWRFLARFLFPSLEQADRVVDQVEADHGREGLQELTWAVIAAWKKASGEDATGACLLSALDGLQRKDVLQSIPNIGEADMCEAAKLTKMEKMRSGLTRNQAAVKSVILMVSQNIGTQWKMLHRDLSQHTHEGTFPENEAIIAQIDHAFDSLIEKAYQALRQWRQTSGNRATFELLMHVLTHLLVSRRDLVDKIKGICKDYGIESTESI